MVRKETPFRKARKQTGMSMHDAAKVLGLTDNTLSAYEIGTRQPNAVTLLHMAKLYGVSADVLIGLRDDG